MKEFQFTIYEILGYLAPGAVALAGLYLAGVALFDARLASLATAGTRVVVGMAVFAYILGHCTHAIANVLFSGLKVDAQAAAEVPECVRAALLQRFEDALGKPLPEDNLYVASDALVTQVGNTELRDVYVYREGFYRGLTVGLPVLGAGILCTWASWRWGMPSPSSRSRSSARRATSSPRTKLRDV